MHASVSLPPRPAVSHRNYSHMFISQNILHHSPPMPAQTYKVSHCAGKTKE